MRSDDMKRSDKKRSIDSLADEGLIALAVEGRQEAFTILMERHKELLTSFVEGIVAAHPAGGGFSMEDAVEPQDICQIALHRAFEHLGEYDSKYAFTTWLYNIAKNAAIDFLRRKRSDYEFKPVRESLFRAGDSLLETSPEDEMIHSQAYAALIGRINNLPPLYKEVAKLRFIEEYALEEISEKLNLRLNTVKTRIKRSKSLLEGEITR